MRKALLTAAMLLCCTATSSSAQTTPNFVGELGFLPPGCEAQLWCELKSDFGFVDSKGIGWQTRAGDKTDGASIPEWAQPMVGAQFDKAFIKAAVIHDHYCNRHVRSWRDTHYVFYEALLASGVPRAQALVMYFAVYMGGPKWVELIQGRPCPVGRGCMERPLSVRSPVNAMRIDAENHSYLVQPATYGSDDFKKAMQRATEITERDAAASVKDMEALARALKPNDFFYHAPDAITAPPAQPVK